MLPIRSNLLEKEVAGPHAIGFNFLVGLFNLYDVVINRLDKPCSSKTQETNEVMTLQLLPFSLKTIHINIGFVVSLPDWGGI